MHLVCVDMPGHAGTTRTSAVDYSIEGQVKRIHQVLFIIISKCPCTHGDTFRLFISTDKISYQCVKYLLETGKYIIDWMDAL